MAFESSLRLPSGLGHESPENHLFTQDHITRMGTERFTREKPSLTGAAMTLRLAVSGAVAGTPEIPSPLRDSGEFDGQRDQRAKYTAQ